MKESKKNKKSKNIAEDVASSKNKDITPKKESNSNGGNNTEGKFDYLIKDRKVRKHLRSRKFTVGLTVFLAITIILGGATYGIISFLHYNNLKVLIDKQNPYIFSLSSTPDFLAGTEVMSVGGPKFMDNVTLLDMYDMIEEVEKHDGTFGKQETNYIAATFYFKNITDKDTQYTESIIIEEVTKNADDALRILVIRDGERRVYAKADKNGEPEEVVPGQYFKSDGSYAEIGEEEDIWMSEPFLGGINVCRNSHIPISAGQVVKYTVLIWLEGWDEECIDQIIGGTVRLAFEFRQN